MDSFISTLRTGLFLIGGVSGEFLLSKSFIEITVFNANNVDPVALFANGPFMGR